jgi:hypothetical protein
VELRNENDNIKAAQIVDRDFKRLAYGNTSGAAVLLNHHESKAGGHGGRGMRDASSPFGLVELQFVLKKVKGRPETQRRLTTDSRHDETPKALILDYVPNGLPPYKSAGIWLTPRHYVRLGAPEEVRHASGDDTVLSVLKAGPATVPELAERTGIARTQLDPRLTALKGKGLVQRSGSGKRGHPYRWSLAKPNGGSR